MLNSQSTDIEKQKKAWQRKAAILNEAWFQAKVEKVSPKYFSASRTPLICNKKSLNKLI